jgi:hypothetical protein
MLFFYNLHLGAHHLQRTKWDNQKVSSKQNTITVNLPPSVLKTWKSLFQASKLPDLNKSKTNQTLTKSYIDKIRGFSPLKLMDKTSVKKSESASSGNYKNTCMLIELS